MNVEDLMLEASEILGVGYNALHTMEAEEYGHNY